MNNIQPGKVFLGFLMVIAIAYLSYLIAERKEGRNEGTSTSEGGSGGGDNNNGNGGGGGDSSSGSSSNAALIGGGVAVLAVAIIGIVLLYNERKFQRNRTPKNEYLENAKQIAQRAGEQEIKTIGDFAKSRNK